jgi:capsular polysaccharide biosynthesis protein
MDRIIRKKFQNIFKFFFQNIFKIAYGKVIYKENNLKDPNIEISQLKNKKIKKFNNENYFVYKIKNGRVYNDLVENVAIINKNQIVDKISYQQNNGRLDGSSKSIILEKGTPRIKKKIKSNLLILSQGASGSNNYFHWLFDILPKIKICSEIYNLNEIDNFYFSELKDYQKKILNIMGIKEKLIFDSNKYRHVQAKNIIIPEHPWYNKGYILEEVNNMPPWIIHWLREIFLPKSEEFNSNEKIFIDRSESKFNHCQIINDNEISKYLESKGFTKYRVGELSFEKQIYLFKNAKIIVGAHGAAFANLIFCSANTKIIEIKPNDHINFISRKISEYINLDYNLIETSPLKKEINQKGDMIVDLDNLKKII